VQLRRRTLRVLAKDPGLFASLLSVHAGDGSALHLSATGLHFGYQFLTA
jgi:hypothetical protein